MAAQRNNDGDHPHAIGDMPEAGVRPPRGEFLRLALLGSGAVGAGLAGPGLTGCALFRAIGRSFTEGAGEGADEWANNHPEEKKKLERIIDDIAAVTSNTKKSSEDVQKISEKVNGLLEKNERNIDKALEATGDMAEQIKRIMSALKAWEDLLKGFVGKAEEALSAVVYFFRRLVAKVGTALAELIAYFFYLAFQKLIQDLIDELKKSFWYWRVLAALF